MSFSFTPQQQQQSPSLFQSQPQQQQQQSPFQQTSLFQPQQLQFQQQQQQQQQQNQLYLFTNEKAPVSYGTKWSDLHPDSQKFLLQIEERILEYRDESQRLDQCNRLYDSSLSNNGFELDASVVVQELGGISTAMERQKAVIQELMIVAKDMLRNTEVAVRSFMMLRPRFLHGSGGSISNASSSSQASGALLAPSASAQPAVTATVPVYDFYSGLPKKPSPFLKQTIAAFEKYIRESRQWIEELEQLLRLDSERNSPNSSASLLESLPKVMSNVHDFFVHVAAKVESIHQYMESMKTAYLADQRRRGDMNDPFLEADRREIAKQEATARRVHPTQHLPANPPTSTQVTGLFASSTTPGTSAIPQTSAGMSSAPSASGTSLFNTPAASTPSSSLFSIPVTSAPVSLFASTGSPQASLFTSFSTSTPSFTNTAPLFSSTPAAGVSTFSTPFGTGATTGSGASFNTASKTRAKSRTGRR